MSSSGTEWGRIERCRSSTARRSVSASRDRLHLAQPCEALERLGLDLTHALARQAEPAADLLERLRLRVGEAVAEDKHLFLALGEGVQRLRKRLAAERDLYFFVRQRAVTGDEIAEDRVLGLADRLVEARRGACGRLHLVRLR